jgi:hypothetical protein
MATTTAIGTTYTIEPPDVSHLVTEDDTPVDNIFSEKQQRLLTHALYVSQPFGNRPFVSSANVGIYYAINKPAVVPDSFVSLDVDYPPDVWEKMHRVYMMWVMGKPPEAVIEIVSNTLGNEAGRKFDIYARMGVIYYVVLDPAHHLSPHTLRVFELRAGEYYEKGDLKLDKLGLGLGLWEGTYENMAQTWLRWQSATGQWLPTGEELAAQAQQQAELAQEQAELALEVAEEERARAEQAQQRAERERQVAEEERARAELAQQRAERERQAAEEERARAELAQQQAEAEHARAEQAQQRAERLAAQLRALGIVPEPE